jgi:hypothetical protein
LDGVVEAVVVEGFGVEGWGVADFLGAIVVFFPLL